MIDRWSTKFFTISSATMFKLFFVLGVVLFASVVRAYVLEAEERKKVELALEESTRDIDRLFSEIAGGYEKPVRPRNDVELRNKASDNDKVGTEPLGLQEPTMETITVGTPGTDHGDDWIVDESLFMNTWGGASVQWNDDASPNKSQNN